ncbi:hypothetical protein LTR85_006220 [Meristemomyces frigidus]|nr:hypothetical protein LTR85_006220 [Meristemomyces frigidus]
MASSEKSTGKVLSPSKLAHVVLRTNKFDQMRAFYKTFLGADEIFANEMMAFLSYDDEHHRIAIIQVPGVRDKDYDTCGLEHIAFTFDSLKDLCTAYKQRKAVGIEPGWCTNHGPTTSMYYRDPDGNQLETQVDNFADPEKATAMMAGDLYRENFLGSDFDPEELCLNVEGGADEEKLKVRKEVGPRGGESLPAILASIRSAPVGA